MPANGPSFFQKFRRQLLWSAALGAILISISVTLFTPVTLLFLFVPLIFVPFALRSRGPYEQDDDDS